MNVKILEINKHRNETTFRPYISAWEEFQRNGIRFIESEKDADFYFVGQASILDKKLSLQESADNGLRFLKELDKPFVVFDGQDSSSLMGTWDTIKWFSGIKCIKNVLLKDYSEYSVRHPNGRWFWGNSSDGYALKEESISELNSVLIPGSTNWLNTYGNAFPYQFNKNKKYDVAILIGLSKDNYEHGQNTTDYYNESRLNLFAASKNLKCNVITTEKTGKLNRNEYLKVLWESKFCVSPFGFGEVNIREIESLMMGTPIIKPDISKVLTHPNIFGEGLSVTCKHDYSDLVEIVDTLLPDYDKIAEPMIKNQYESYQKQSSAETLVSRTIRDILT
jgi:glycosyltransferase involved in cell wall biosynthesis